MRHEFLLKADAFEKIYLRRRSFLQLKDTLSFSDGDRILLKELRGDVVTGRSILLELTEVRPGAREGYVLCSFVILFPEIEPSIPITVYMELWNKLTETHRQLEAARLETR